MNRFWLSPVAFFVFLGLLLVTWGVMEPAALVRAFDGGGYSPFELATIPVFLAIPVAVWWKCPFTGSRTRRTVLCAAVTCVALMAVVKELDLHLKVMQALFPQIVNADGSVYGLVKPNGQPLTGTPFKMRFLTNGGAPLAAKACVVLYFGAFFGVFAALLAYFAKPFVVGVFKLNPVAWTVGCFGGSGVLVQLCDRLPAWYRHARHLSKPPEGLVDSAQALCTALEEGGEMMLALFAVFAILQAHALLARTSDSCA